MLATVVLLVLTGTLSDDAFLSWGWRVAFWLSAVVVLIGYYIRTKVTDAPIFVAAQQEVERVKAASYGVVEVLKRYPRGVFTAMGLRFAENIMYYLVVTFSITYLKVQVDADTSDILWWLLAAHAVHFVVIPLVGRLSDHVGRRPVYFVGALAAGTWGFFAFPMMNSANYLVIMGAVISRIWSSTRSCTHRSPRSWPRCSPPACGIPVCPLAIRSPRSSPARWRRSSRSNYSRVYDSSVPIALYLAGAAVITLIAVYFTRETKGIDLATVDQADRDDLAKAGVVMSDLNGRTALVTGGASGIGAACARELAARGAVVTVADVDEAGAKDLAQDIGGQAWAVDLLDVSSLENLQLETDILVNNAGVQSINSIVDFAPERFRTMMTLMVEAPFLLIRAALPHMYRQKFGRVINISSVHGIRASEYKVAYVTAKHALEGLSKVTALEGGPHDVTSNCVNPGYVRTPLVTKQIADQARTHGIPEDQVVAEILLKESAIKRLVEPEEVAALVGWLASPAAGMVTGASYTMDGGWSAR